eukprot:6588762-Prymnesium_polylepis.1
MLAWCELSDGPMDGMGTSSATPDDTAAVNSTENGKKNWLLYRYDSTGISAARPPPRLLSQRFAVWDES